MDRAPQSQFTREGQIVDGRLPRGIFRAAQRHSHREQLVIRVEILFTNPASIGGMAQLAFRVPPINERYHRIAMSEDCPHP
jgi:hypothetical protein